MMQTEEHFEFSGRSGLHARPAMRLMEVARQFEADIRISSGCREADAGSIFGIMCLAIDRGMGFTVRASGTDADEAVAAISTFLMGKNLARPVHSSIPRHIERLDQNTKQLTPAYCGAGV